MRTSILAYNTLKLSEVLSMYFIINISLEYKESDNGLSVLAI